MTLNNSRKYFLFSVLFFAFLIPMDASAKLPPIDFAAARLLKSRLPASYDIEISLLEKTITKYSGVADLFSGDFSVGSLAISKASKSTSLRFFAIAFGSQNIVEDVETSFSRLDKKRLVSVHHNALTHRYGSSTSVSIFRDSGALAKIQATIKGEVWILEVSDLGPMIFGTITQGGLIVMRFTIRKK